MSTINKKDKTSCSNKDKADLDAGMVNGRGIDVTGGVPGTHDVGLDDCENDYSGSTTPESQDAEQDGEEDVYIEQESSDPESVMCDDDEVHEKSSDANQEVLITKGSATDNSSTAQAARMNRLVELLTRPVHDLVNKMAKYRDTDESFMKAEFEQLQSAVAIMEGTTARLESTLGLVVRNQETMMRMLETASKSSKSLQPVDNTSATGRSGDKRTPKESKKQQKKTKTSKIIGVDSKQKQSKSKTTCDTSKETNMSIAGKCSSDKKFWGRLNGATAAKKDTKSNTQVASNSQDATDTPNNDVALVNKQSKSKSKKTSAKAKPTNPTVSMSVDSTVPTATASQPGDDARHTGVPSSSKSKTASTPRAQAITQSGAAEVKNQQCVAKKRKKTSTVKQANKNTKKPKVSESVLHDDKAEPVPTAISSEYATDGVMDELDELFD